MTKKINNNKHLKPKQKKAEKVQKELQLDSDTRLNFCRLEAEVRASKNQLTMEQMKLTQLIKDLDKEGVIAKSQVAVYESAKQLHLMEAKYFELKKDIEKKLNIELKDYGFDDETGILHKIES
jgi:hypothetical protein